MKYKLIAFLIPVFSYTQNIDMYLSLIYEGQSDGVKENLPELVSKYPNDPGVMYLQAILTINGMKSLELYSKLLDNFPKSKYAGEAALKIGEYFYARGLYTQAGRQLCNIPRRYPRVTNMQNVMDMIVSSFKAIGENDSVEYYIGLYESMFPNLNFSKYGIDVSAANIIMNNSVARTKQPKPYVIQIGAFSSIQNAKRLKLQVKQIGYKVEIKPVETNGKSLHTVRVVRYKSKSSAERIGDLIKKKLGVDYRVLYRPINSN